MRFRKPTLLLLGLVLLGVAFAGWGYASAVSDPVVRRAEVRLPALRGSAPLKLLLISDIHVAGPDMPPERLARIVGRINALRPDAVLIAGDFVGDRKAATRHYGTEQSVAPLAALRARLGVFAVLGNHDHWRNAPEIDHALERAGIRVLDNEAVRIGGITLAGIDDSYTRHARYRKVETYAAALPGPAVLLSHAPDAMKHVSARFPLILAGHTHCGQIVLPYIGALATASTLRKRYTCGVVRDPEHILVVGAGLGTSLLPIRFGAPPDWWLLTLQGDNAGRQAARRLDTPS